MSAPFADDEQWDDEQRARVFCNARLRYTGSKPVPVVKRSFLFLNPEGWPIEQDLATDLLTKELRRGDDLELEYWGYFPFPGAADEEQVAKIQVSLFAVLYPVEWCLLAEVAQPKKSRIESRHSIFANELEVLSWCIAKQGDWSDMAKYHFEVYLANRGPSTVPAAVVQLAISTGQADLSTEVVECLAPGEERLVTGSLVVSAERKRRNAAKVTLKVGTSIAPEVVRLPAQVLGTGFSNDITVRIPMTKGDGSSLPASRFGANERANPASMCEFALSADVQGVLDDHGNVQIESCEVIYDGVTHSKRLDCGLTVTRVGLDGYPSPIIRFKLSAPVSVEDFRIAVMHSSVTICPRLQDPTHDRDGHLRHESAWIAEDRNGYTTAMVPGELSTWRSTLEEVGLHSGKVFTKDQLIKGISLSGLCTGTSSKAPRKRTKASSH